MRVIYKYELAITNVQNISMPDVASPLAVAEQNGRLMLWAAVDPTTPPRDRRFRIIGTGHPISDENDWLHLGTVVMSSGLVWHVCQETSASQKQLLAQSV